MELTFKGGELTLHEVGAFVVFEYLNPYGIPLIYITARNPENLRRYGLPRKSSFVFQDQTYWHIGVPKQFVDFAGGDESIGLCFH